MMIDNGTFSRIASLGCIGYLPGSGTIASLCMIPCIYLLYYFQIPLHIQAIFIVILAVQSFFIINRALPLFINNDPSEIVLDECIGMFVAMYALPISWLAFFLAFMLFRLFDISKIFGLTLFERLPGAWGILLDDIIAACFTNVILRFVIPLVCA